MEPLKVEIERQAAKVTQLKAASTTGKPELQSEIDKLVALKKQLAALELSSIPSAVTAPVEPKFDRAGLEELLKKRFFYAPSFGIYGGMTVYQLLISINNITQEFPVFLIMVRRVAPCKPISWIAGVNILSSKKICWRSIPPF